MGVKSSSFSPLNTSGAEGGSTLLDRIQALLKKALDALANGKLDNSTLVPATIAAVDTTVYHNLGQPVASWDIVDRDANANVWRSPTVNGNPSRTIILRASVPVNVVIRFA